MRHKQHVGKVHGTWARLIGLSSRRASRRVRYAPTDRLLKTLVVCCVDVRMEFKDFLILLTTATAWSSAITRPGIHRCGRRGPGGFLRQRAAPGRPAGEPGLAQASFGLLRLRREPVQKEGPAAERPGNTGRGRRRVAPRTAEGARRCRGLARFMLDRLTGQQVAAIVQAVLARQGRPPPRSQSRCRAIWWRASTFRSR